MYLKYCRPTNVLKFVCLLTIYRVFLLGYSIGLTLDISCINTVNNPYIVDKYNVYYIGVAYVT